MGTGERDFGVGFERGVSLSVGRLVCLSPCLFAPLLSAQGGQLIMYGTLRGRWRNFEGAPDAEQEKRVFTRRAWTCDE